VHERPVSTRRARRFEPVLRHVDPVRGRDSRPQWLRQEFTAIPEARTHCGQPTELLCYGVLVSLETRVRWSVWIGWFLWAVLAGLSVWLVASPATALQAHEQAQQQFHWIPFFAAFHSVILHFPIGFIVILGILELHMFQRRDSDWRRVIHLLVSLTAWSAVTVACFGLLRGSGGGYDQEILRTHFISGLIVATLAVVALTLHAPVALLLADGLRLRAYRVVLVALSAVVVVTGHQGSNLTHGSRYLVRNAPDFVREYWMGTPDGSLPLVSLEENQKQYVREILPIFEQKCKKCHGENAQMNGYRLDVEDVAFGGGKSGEKAIVAGDPAASNLVRAILLNQSHPKFMPPAGLPPLTPDELIKIIAWIRDGAAYVPDELALLPLVETGKE